MNGPVQIKINFQVLDAADPANLKPTHEFLMMLHPQRPTCTAYEATVMLNAIDNILRTWGFDTAKCIEHLTNLVTTNPEFVEAGLVEGAIKEEDVPVFCGPNGTVQ